jgi:hypothetical protein
MNATKQLHELGQSLWLDNITRGLLESGTLKSYLRDLAVTGLTSNPTIFDHAIRNTQFYDKAIAEKASKGKSGEGLFFDLALEDLTRAADFFLPIHDATAGVSRSACSGPAPAPKTRWHRIPCIWRRSPRLIRSIPFPKKRCWLSPIMAGWAAPWRRTAQTRTGHSLLLRRPASTWKLLPHSFSTRELNPSARPGRI